MFSICVPRITGIVCNICSNCGIQIASITWEPLIVINDGCNGDDCSNDGGGCSDDDCVVVMMIR